MNVPFRLLRLFVVTAGALTALAAVPASASATPASGASGFAAQASQAGLTSAQTAQLQARVNADLARTGGTQVAANEIRTADGAELLLALPGERTARSLDGGITPNAAGGCPFQFFCGFNGPNFSG